MHEHDIIKEAEEISREMQETKEELKKARNPLWYILAVFLILIIILMMLPSYSVKLDPEPKSIPQISDVVPGSIKINESAATIRNRNDYLLLLNPGDETVKRTADRIIALSGCNSNKICHAKALFYFVRDRFNYVSDPTSFEYVKSARESLFSQGGDCDDASVLLANLLQSVGIHTRFVFVPQHVYVHAYIPDTIKRYRDNAGWVNLDSTCQYCDFGETPFKYADSEKGYVG